jgi:type IV pilus assembly protein PilC
VPRRELIEFCTLMSFQCRVGIPLLQALDLAGQDCQTPRFKRVIGGMQMHIEAGLLFYEALEKYPGTFSPHFVSIVRAGELSSKLPEAFTDLKEYLEWVEQVLADVRQASLYPAITLVVVSAFGLFLFTFIIPKFVVLLEGLKVPIPMLTRIIFGVSDFAKATWWVWVLGLIFLMVGIPIGRRMSKGFAYAMDYIKIHLPIFGELNLMLALSRFSHNLSILYSSGIPIIQALTLCQGLIDCVPVERAVNTVETDVKAGHTISEAMRKHKIFPPILLRMVTMGEGTGTLDKSLQNVSDYYNEIIPRRIKKVFTFLEPAMTLMLIFMVGAIALSIYLPLLTLMSSIGK